MIRHQHGPSFIPYCVETVIYEGIAIAITGDRAHAERIDQLLERHGLADVPDHINDWPPPCGLPHPAPEPTP